MAQQTLITDVTDTSFWVAYYRAKESERPDALFHDPLAKALVGTIGQGISQSMKAISKYTEWSVISRTVIIDRFIGELIAEGVDAVINLGAGLDTRPYRLQLPKDFEWIEVDFPNIISHKSQLLQSEVPKCQLTRVAIDLTKDQLRKDFFHSILPHAKKVLILTEGVLPYLTSEQVTKLSADLFEHPRFAFWITEYFDPKVYPYLKKTVRTLKMKNAPFQFYPDNWFGFFNRLGWYEKQTRFSSEIAIEFQRMPPMRIWAKILMPFFSKKFIETSRRLAGYTILQREPKPTH